MKSVNKNQSMILAFDEMPGRLITYKPIGAYSQLIGKCLVTKKAKVQDGGSYVLLEHASNYLEKIAITRQLLLTSDLLTLEISKPHFGKPLRRFDDANVMIIDRKIYKPAEKYLVVDLEIMVSLFAIGGMDYFVSKFKSNPNLSLTREEKFKVLSA